MTLRHYVKIWLFLLVVLGAESWMLNHHPEAGILSLLKNHFGLIPHVSLNPTTGKSISLFLGWAGFSILCLTNLYVLRKRFFPRTSLGKLSGWLNFHIFCGLLGPLLILLHTNFKIGGLVAISFWSMVISFLSGIVGRYFYLQVTGQEKELEKKAEAEEKLVLAHARLPAEAYAAIKKKALALAGVPETNTPYGLFRTLVMSLVGDLRLRMQLSTVASALPPAALPHLQLYLVNTRRWHYLEHFRKMMGYWHSFHMPFAIFMYGVAVIHILTALLLGVGEV